MRKIIDLLKSVIKQISLSRRKIKDFLKTVMSPKIIKFLIKLKNYVRYPFVSEMEKGVIRFYATNYDRKKVNLKLKDNDIVFDLGGFKGDYTGDLLEYNPKINSYIFEPVKSYYENIRNRFINNPNVRVFNFGLSNTNHVLPINIQGEGSSFFRKFTIEGIEECKIIDIHEFIMDNNINKISLIKINIEGSEYPLLERLISTGDIKKFQRLLIQFHEVDDKSYDRMANIWKNLEKTHNLIWQFKPYVWEYWEEK